MVMDELKEYGIDYDTAMQRCVGSLTVQSQTTES